MALVLTINMRDGHSFEAGRPADRTAARNQAQAVFTGTSVLERLDDDRAIFWPVGEVKNVTVTVVA